MSVYIGSHVLDVPLAPPLCHHDGYQHYPCSVDQRLNLLRGLIQDAVDNSARQTFLAGWSQHDKRLDALFIAGRFNLGEECFGFGMAHVHHFLVATDLSRSDSSTAAHCLYRAFTDWAERQDVAHAACRTTIDNQPVNDLFNSMGLSPVDRVVCHLVRPDHLPRFPRLKAFHEIRPYRCEHRNQILRLCTDRFTTSRFVTDPELPQTGKKRFFNTWAEKICNGDMADRIWVAVDAAGSVVGFMGWRTQLEWLKHLDLKVAGEGLGAVLPSGTGAYVPMLRHCILDAFADEEQGTTRPIDMAELETQVQRTEVIKVWNRLGIGQVSASQTYHHWLRH